MSRLSIVILIVVYVSVCFNALMDKAMPEMYKFRMRSHWSREQWRWHIFKWVCLFSVWILLICIWFMYVGIRPTTVVEIISFTVLCSISWGCIYEA